MRFAKGLNPFEGITITCSPYDHRDARVAGLNSAGPGARKLQAQQDVVPAECAAQNSRTLAVTALSPFAQRRALPGSRMGSNLPLQSWNTSNSNIFRGP